MRYLLNGVLLEEDIRAIYNDIKIQKNESGIEELGFKTKALARKFVLAMVKLSQVYHEDRTRFSMQLIADIIKRLRDDGEITVEQLYDMKEADVIDLIRKSKYSEQFEKWLNAKKINTSKEKPEGVYTVNFRTKIRYIDPLCNGVRMSKQCEICKNAIDKNLAYDMNKWLYLDFDFADNN